VLIADVAGEIVLLDHVAHIFEDLGGAAIGAEVHGLKR
jgi:hypothetical protein